MAINRTQFSSKLPATEQATINKVIVANTTMRGYLHIVAVRTKMVNEQPVEVFTDLLIHPDRAAKIDVAKFDAISIQGFTPREAPGERRTNTEYGWAAGVTAVGKHLVEQAIVEDEQTGEEKQVLVYAGVGLYGPAPEPTDSGVGFNEAPQQ